MYNSKRTLEVFGYDLENKKRRSKEELEAMGKTKPKDMDVIDNCPTCNVERTIKLNQSRKNKPCLKCFHNTSEMQHVKLAQKGKQLSEQHKQSLKDNHWSKHGGISAFKGKTHSNEVKRLLAEKGEQQFSQISQDDFELHRIKSSLQRGRTLETFKGFTAPESTRIRQSAEGKAWTYDILSKANFTCIKCSERGGQLHAHHLNGFNSFPDQRLNVDNGACLCETCHEKFHEAYGKGDNTKEQFEEWLNLK